MDPHFYNNLINADLSSFIPAMKGGLTIAFAATLYYYFFGGILGMSGLAGSIVKFPTMQLTKLKSIILLGMLSASAAVLAFSGLFRDVLPTLPFDQERLLASTATSHLIVAGLLVGVGTELSNGCTSGHGLCGMPRLSVRSMASVVVFLVTAIATATLNLKAWIPDISQLRIPFVDNLSIPPQYFLLLGVSLALFLAITQRQKSFAAKVILFVVGVIFGFGLMMAGMSQRSKIYGFLQLNSSWDPSLLFVLMTGVLVNALTFNLILNLKRRPVFGEKIQNPKGSVDGKLILGSLLFGLGWGIGGLCPGPYILSIPFSIKVAFYWGVPFFLGQKISSFLTSKSQELKKGKIS